MSHRVAALIGVAFATGLTLGAAVTGLLTDRRK